MDVRKPEELRPDEAALIEKAGEAGKKLHTARSRNDQVITDVRLWMRDAIDETKRRLEKRRASTNACTIS